MFESISLFAVIVCLIFITIYRFKKHKKNKPSLLKNLTAFLPLVLAIVLLKSIFIGSFKVTTPSMLPSLESGDFVLINKFAYGIKSPFSQQPLISTGAPKRGEAVIFYWSKENKEKQLKRIIGLPGDNIELRDKRIVINGVNIPTRYYGGYDVPNNDTDYLVFNEDIPIEGENNFAYSSMILEYEHYLSTDENASWVVPQGHFFVLGDNRDNSIDSRTQGFVPANNIIGKASTVWFHKGQNGVSFSRFSKPTTYSLPETTSEE